MERICWNISLPQSAAAEGRIKVGIIQCRLDLGFQPPLYPMFSLGVLAFRQRVYVFLLESGWPGFSGKAGFVQFNPENPYILEIQILTNEKS